MKIEVEKRGHVGVLKMAGSLDADSIALFKKRSNDLVDQGMLFVVIDATKMDFVDSMGLGSMISLMRRLKMKGGDVKVCGVTRDVKEIFEITRLNKLFDVCGNLDEAVNRFEN